MLSEAKHPRMRTTTDSLGKQTGLLCFGDFVGDAHLGMFRFAQHDKRGDFVAFISAFEGWCVIQNLCANGTFAIPLSLCRGRTYVSALWLGRATKCRVNNATLICAAQRNVGVSVCDRQGEHTGIAPTRSRAFVPPNRSLGISPKRMAGG